MKDGTVLICVYVVPERPYIKHWGVYPQQDRGKSYISLSDVDKPEAIRKRVLRTSSAHQVNVGDYFSVDLGGAFRSLSAELFSSPQSPQ
jgi:hypothetical protein